MRADEAAVQRFGRVVAQSRAKSGKTQASVARELGISTGHMSNMERGRRTPNPSEIPLLDSILETNGRLARLWDELTDSGDMDFLDKLAALEREATAIQAYEVTLIPGLLQTEDYARTIIRAGAPWLTASEVELKISERMKRVEQFAAGELPLLRVVMDIGAVRRVVGSRETMGAQLRKVVDFTEQGRVMVQVIGDEEVRHPGLTGSFSVLSSTDRPDVAYAESIHTGQTVDDPQQVANYRMLFGTLQAVARHPEDSVQLIRDEMRDCENEAQ